MNIPSLFESIPDLMQVIVTNFLHGHIESYVESIGSVIKHHFPPNRNIDRTTLEEKTKISWNGPEIPSADDVIRETLNSMYGPNKWHVTRNCSRVAELKFFHVSEAVDRYQSAASPYYL